MTALRDLKVQVFADGADLNGISELARNPIVKGFTTNPTLMRKAGVRDYKEFAQEALRVVGGRPISFEVFSDDFAEMEEQALEIASWGKNVNVKIPVTNTRGEFAGPLISRLSERGVFLNVTALMTVEQVTAVTGALTGTAPAYISVFAGRIADSGRDPLPIMSESVRVSARRPKTEIIWASPRELLNIFQADAAKVQVITVANDLLRKLDIVGKDLTQYSLETVKMFYDDAKAAGYSVAATAAGART
jgi:transaldolase